MTRRGMLLGAFAAVAPDALRATEVARLLVAGPSGGRLDGLAGVLGPLLTHAWPGSTLDIHTAGGEDGVTGANQFAARFESEGEGTALLLLPGACIASWLAGGTRVRYDAARWVPLLCGGRSGVFASRRSRDMGSSAEPWRVAVPDPLGPAATCLLGLDLLGIVSQPLRAPDTVAALRAGRVEAAFLPDPDALATASSAGATPLFRLGVAETTPALPSLDELLAAHPGDPALSSVSRAVAAAALLDFALVVPALTPAPAIALWREAAARAVASPDLAAAVPADVRTATASGCAAMLAATALEPPSLLAYRQWLGDRLGYRAG